MSLAEGIKYCFIINPCAGPEDASRTIGKNIPKICETFGLEYEIAVTEYPGHAIRLAESFADNATPEHPARIFAVGGDGTLCEVVNGVVGRDFCEIGCIPCGSGNDYVKSFGRPEQFLALERYLSSPSVSVDVINAGKMNSINICSLGLDAKICDRANRIKAENKALSGPKAYEKAIVQCFFGKLYNYLTVTVDGDPAKTYKGRFLFTIAASGQYYGGGFKGAPMADPTDGMLDFIMIKTMPHLRVPLMLNSYKAGEYMEDKRFKRLVTHVRGSSIRIQSKKPSILNVDGECFPINDITLRILPKALRFIVPTECITAKNKARHALSDE